MKKQLAIAVAILALGAAGCQDKPQEKPKETTPAAVPQAGLSSPQVPQAPIPVQNNPYAAVPPPAQPTVAVHKGKVLDTMNAAGYTYLQIEEKGQKVWAAASETELKVGDMVEFPDSPAMQNFTSKTLKRTFDKIFFVSSLRINGK